MGFLQLLVAMIALYLFLLGLAQPFRIAWEMLDDRRADARRRRLDEKGPDDVDPLPILDTKDLPSYYSLEVVSMLMEFAIDFSPPQRGMNGGTGLYRGEQDLFCLLIDPTGRVEIEGEAFAPGFFAWNSEVGRRSVGVQSFWFQAVCANHIVWDAVGVREVTRTHTSKVGGGAARDASRRGDARRAARRVRRSREEGNDIQPWGSVSLPADL